MSLILTKPKNIRQGSRKNLILIRVLMIFILLVMISGLLYFFLKKEDAQINPEKNIDKNKEDDINTEVAINPEVEISQGRAKIILQIKNVLRECGLMEIENMEKEIEKIDNIPQFLDKIISINESFKTDMQKFLSIDPQKINIRLKDTSSNASIKIYERKTSIKKLQNQEFEDAFYLLLKNLNQVRAIQLTLSEVSNSLLEDVSLFPNRFDLLHISIDFYQHFLSNILNDSQRQNIKTNLTKLKEYLDPNRNSFPSERLQQYFVPFNIKVFDKIEELLKEPIADDNLKNKKLGQKKKKNVSKHVSFASEPQVIFFLKGSERKKIR